jgi:hypothetical protein
MATFKHIQICGASYPMDMSFGLDHQMPAWPTNEEWEAEFGQGAFGEDPFGGGPPDALEPNTNSWDGFRVINRFDSGEAAVTADQFTNEFGVESFGEAPFGGDEWFDPAEATPGYSLDSAGPQPFTSTHGALLIAAFRGPYDNVNGTVLSLRVNTDSEATREVTFSGTDPIAASDLADDINTASAAGNWGIFAWGDSWGRLTIKLISGDIGGWIRVRDCTAAPLFGWPEGTRVESALDEPVCVYPTYQVCPVKINSIALALDASASEGEAADALSGGFGAGPLGGQGFGN